MEELIDFPADANEAGLISGQGVESTLHLQVRASVGFSPCAYRGLRHSQACARHSSTVTRAETLLGAAAELLAEPGDRGEGWTTILRYTIVAREIVAS